MTRFAVLASLVLMSVVGLQPSAHAADVPPVVEVERAWAVQKGAALEVAYTVTCPDRTDRRYQHAMWTNGDYLEFVEATRAKPPHFWQKAEREWLWRGMFELRPLPLDTPVYVTHDEAVSYLRWKGKRLPTEAEYHRAAFGTPEGHERTYPWGEGLPAATRGNFDFASFDPVAVGSYPDSASAWGVHDLIGNGWEWTSSFFSGFNGFEPMPSYPEYSADFFDDAHFVMKGASPVTARELVRPSFRNWFRPSYPFVYATFRGIHS